MSKRMIYESNMFSIEEAKTEFKDALEEVYNQQACDLSDEQVLDFLDDFDEDCWRIEVDNLCKHMPDNIKLITYGSATRWNGVSHGFVLADGFNGLLDNHIWKDCEYFNIWDEDGRLFMKGYHHDGYVNLEIKCMSKKGQALLESWEQKNKEYNLNIIWDDPNLSYIPCFAEKVYGIENNNKDNKYEDIEKERER